jgi:hypothetical protein
MCSDDNATLDISIVVVTIAIDIDAIVLIDVKYVSLINDPRIIIRF